MKELMKMIELEQELKKPNPDIEKINKMVYDFNKIEKEWTVDFKSAGDNRNQLIFKITK